ncbi:hypothetical protein IAT38_002747 [Cryptococcus sp. DSM 104549]
MSKHVQAIQLEQVKIDLSDLSAEILSLSLTILSPVKHAPPPRSTSPSLSPSPPSFSKPPAPPTRFYRFTSTLKSARQRSLKKTKGWSWGTKYDKMDEPLLTRRGSADSDMTLVEREDAEPGKKGIAVSVDGGDSSGGYSAGELLALLAPVVSTLQRLGIRFATLSAQMAEDNLLPARAAFLDGCHQLSDLLASLRPPTLPPPNDRQSSVTTAMPVPSVCDPQEHEMCSLMLDALARKVQVEQDKLDKLRGDGSYHSVASPTSSRNPFVIHAATPSSTTISATANGTRRGSAPSAPVKIGAPAPGGPGMADGVSYRSFMAGSQQSTWATHVVRLGSFQASALFTPSPIAVRRMVGSGNRGVT